MEEPPAPQFPEPEEPRCVGIALVGRGGSYLVRQRPEGTAMAGYWEFPGGKCEPGETPAAAAARECREEIGLDVTVGRLRRHVVHRYPHAWVHLSYFDCALRDAAAEPVAATGFRWVAAAALAALRFPEANEPIVAELAGEAAAGSAADPF
jgi:mutator protein MutT